MMPLFEFKCNGCGKEFDLFKFTQLEEEEKKCPQCGSKDVTQLISDFGLGGGCDTGGRSGFSFG